MKKVIKNDKYVLTSGYTIIGFGSTIKEILEFIGVSFSYVYTYKNKNIFLDDTWSFQYKGYIYTIYTTDELRQKYCTDEQMKSAVKKYVIGNN